MKQEPLRRLLTQLHSELQTAPSVEDNNRALLHSLASDIETLLNYSQHTSLDDVQSRDHRTTLAHRLESSIAVFEISHPNLTATMNSIIATLNNLGI